VKEKQLDPVSAWNHNDALWNNLTNDLKTTIDTSPHAAGDNCFVG